MYTEILSLNTPCIALSGFAGLSASAFASLTFFLGWILVEFLKIRDRYLEDLFSFFRVDLR
ncbi:MAG: hypothetical protein ACKJSG_18760, partial [Lentisphaeria bacterium]